MQPSFLAKLVRRSVFELKEYEHWGLLCFWLFALGFYFYGLGHLPFVGPDEPRYAQVAREMLQRHDLITPTLGGRTWFEKPALLYWMMIASFKLFGVSEWAARLPSAVSGVLTIAAVYSIGNRIEARYLKQEAENSLPLGFWSALALTSTVGIVALSRAASFDILLTMTTTWAAAFYVRYALEEPEGYRDKVIAKRLRGYLAGFYIFIGLSLLAKGLVGIVIPFGVAALFYLFQRRLPRRATWISLLWGLPLAMLVASAWYGPVIWRHGWPFIDQFFVQHHFARYVSKKYHHWQPIYYYFIVVPLLSLPWTVFLVEGLWKARSSISLARYPDGSEIETRLNRLRVFALAWFFFPLIFFSFSGSKLPGYILPVLPAAALIVGEKLWLFSWDYNFNRRPIKLTANLYILFAIGVPIYARITGELSLTCALSIAVLLLVTAFSALGLTRPIFRFAASTLIVLVIALHCIAPRAAELESSKRMIELADARGYSQAVVYGMQRSDRTPEFYAAGRIIYGADGEPIMYDSPAQPIDESRRRAGPVLSFVPVAEVNQLAATPFAQVEVIANNGRYAIVAVRAR